MKRKKNREGLYARDCVLNDRYFWEHIKYCIKAVMPLVCVLREVDSEVRPAMGYIYKLMDSAKGKIARSFGNVEAKYISIWKRIDARWNPQLHRPLHAAGYYLNPQFRYEDDFTCDEELKEGLEACMDRMIDDQQERINAELQLDLYDRKLSKFGSNMALRTRKVRSPG